jgi:hypothetical protein
MKQSTSWSQRQTVAVVCLVAGGLAALANVAWGEDLLIPRLTRWERQMRVYGEKHCTTLAQVSGDEALAATYYDMIRVMYQIADYTGDAVWKACALRARDVYRDAYVLRHKGQVPGYWNFTTGLRMDYGQSRDRRSHDAVLLMSQAAAYSPDWTPLEGTRRMDLSREVAYTIVGYIDAEALGEPRRTRRAALVNQAYGHLDQCFAQFVWRDSNGKITTQFSPFMVGLTAHALIRDWEQTGDVRLIPALTRAADWLWANAWIRRDRAMWYEAAHPTKAAPDLNLLIAPLYALLYRQTGDSKYRDQGDALFAGGVDLAWLAGAKQFNQNYWWSFDYVRWRR